jgi:ribokinase
MKDLFAPSNVEGPKTDWLYLSSVSDSDFSVHQQIIDWLTAHPETRLAFSPGTWQIKLGREKLKDIYARTEILFCNKQEAEKISSADLRNATSNEPEVRLRTLAESIKTLGPKTVVITDGEQGASALDNENKFYQVPAFLGLGEALERTGAGDAFASAYLTAIANGKGTEEALTWGAINSASVVTKIGPHEGLLTRPQIEEKLK